MFKRLVAAFLCVLMIVPFFSGCSSYDPKENVGETLNVYLGNEVYNFDPAYAYASEEALQLTRLLYAGLFYINKDGELKKDLVKKYEIENDKNQSIYRITLKLNERYWSDGNAVSAKDILFAWKRILDPTTVSDAAVLLYEIKNAYDAKNGNCSIDDIGVYAIDTYTLQIDFEAPIDFEDFLYNLASPCLVPVRQTAVSNGADWAKRPSTMLFSGPFIIREVKYGQSLTLERNAYYKRDTDKDSIKKYVTPYQIVVDYTKSPKEQLEAYKKGELVYIADIALEDRAEFKSEAKVYDSLSTLSVYFNLDNEIFADANTRKALSDVIDRNAIAEALVFADAATGLVPNGVFEATKASKSFRKVGGNLLSTTAVSTSGSFSGEFTIAVADNEVNVAVAEMLKSAWEKLGFNVSINKLSTSATDVILKGEDKPTTAFVNDDYTTALQNRDFDVIIAEISDLDTDAFSMLSTYATGYSGRNMTFTIDSYTDPVNITGYVSEEYTALINEAFAEKNVAKRAAKLHEAEALLMKDMPVCPIVFTSKAVLISGVKGITVAYFGYNSFREAKLK